MVSIIYASLNVGEITFTVYRYNDDVQIHGDTLLYYLVQLFEQCNCIFVLKRSMISVNVSQTNNR